ncbi:MAG: hypothetical protein QXT45_06405 [Candidatus Bilamarchaeaceae archaeon]
MDPSTKIRLVRFGIIALVIAVIALIIIGVAQVKFPKIETTVPRENITSEIAEHEGTEVIEVECNEACVYEKGLQNVSYCAQLENATLAERCYERWANESLEACIRLNGDEKEACILLHANRTKDLTICELAENKTACRIVIEPCYAYIGSKRNLCLALSKNVVAYCEGEEDCIFNYSITKNDGNACEEIKGNTKRFACLSIIEDKNRCGELALGAEQDYCLELYATITNNKNICYGISKTSDYALRCFSYFAGLTRDPNFCVEGGFELDELWRCYINYSLTTGDLEGCNRIHPLATTNRYTCYGQVAKVYGNPHACDYLNDSYTLGMRSTCYEGSILGNKRLNYTYCADVVVEKWRNKCYTEYAKMNNDPSVCDYIPTTPERGTCVDAWRVYTNSTIT